MLLQQLIGALAYMAGKCLAVRNTRNVFARQVMKHVRHRPEQHNSLESAPIPLTYTTCFNTMKSIINMSDVGVNWDSHLESFV